MIRTERLILRPWREADRAPLAAMMGDALVRRFFPTVLDRAGADAWMDRTQAHIDRHGFGIWAAEDAASGALAGYVGLAMLPDHLPPAPGVELVWTLAPRFWRHGYGGEAARAAIGYGFDTLGLAEMVAFTAAINVPSWRLMERLGMVHDLGGDFDHPRIPPGHPLCRHVLYRQVR